MPTCPNGHQSVAEDWCEVCGHRMAGAVPPPPSLPAGFLNTPPPGQPGPPPPPQQQGPPPGDPHGQPGPPPGMPGPGNQGGYGFPPPPPAPGPGNQGGYGFPPPAPGPDQAAPPEPCPQCGTPREANAPFCENCRYNFLTHSSTSPASFAPPPGMPGPGAQGGQGGYGFPPPAPHQQPPFDPQQPPQQPSPYEPQQQPAPAPGPGTQGGQGGYGFPPPAPHQQPPFDPQQPPQQGPPPGMPGPGGYPGQPGPPPPQQGDDWTLNPPGAQQQAAPPMAPPSPGPGPQAPFEQQPPAPFPPQQPGPYEPQQQPFEQQQQPGPYDPQQQHQGPPPEQQWNGGPGPGPAAPPQGPPPVVGDGWVVAIAPDREYFMAMMGRSGPEAAGLNLPAYSPEQVLPLAGGQIAIGRRRNSTGEAPDVDLGRAPEDPGVSHQHALLVQQQDGSWAVVDQNSTNGTTVNLAEEPVQPYVPVPLHDGDRVHVGAWTTLTVRRG
ncbi:FHA domain-containing protein [Streptomyces sp. NPDC048650]|uniref:FHA domain-containing protein n=1 Tax=Streptomyces sp. NPDC048650 TaxID=3365583 RepID=UPI003713B6CD